MVFGVELSVGTGVAEGLEAGAVTWAGAEFGLLELPELLETGADTASTGTGCTESGAKGANEEESVWLTEEEPVSTTFWFTPGATEFAFP
jgi:hypothetical protein